ncbi:acyl-CoA thioesterase [Paraburkholderia fynbosensis]|uniref:1,4-dihydroxy-2-naphthoyl-CoA hydrolase n=1 Tax=Paraburkholderia fynbosensis TaxID=1200993 RepID=A0A6J5H7U7_9BURK|nr:thioesterase family protein [Paraburkholderia fynbosensis]CAB3810482.1 1,4-dihydroxy-2-naphthoyl-CoA hydrolase [Paraburkholderia fynbosensis]
MEESSFFEVEKLIRFQHCDPAGIVFYPQYFVLFHELIEDWFGKGLGVDYGSFISSQRLGIPTVHLECNFAAPSKIGDVLTFRLAVRKLGSTSIALSLSACDKDQVRVHVNQTVVLLSLESRQPQPISADLRSRMSSFLVAEQTA